MADTNFVLALPHSKFFFHTIVPEEVWQNIARLLSPDEIALLLYGTQMQPHCPKQQPPRIQRKLTSRLLNPALRVAAAHKRKLKFRLEQQIVFLPQPPPPPPEQAVSCRPVASQLLRLRQPLPPLLIDASAVPDNLPCDMISSNLGVPTVSMRKFSARMNEMKSPRF